MKTITPELISNKEVVIRIDTDVPLDDKLNVSDETRLLAVVPTLSLLTKHAKKIVILGHLGRPNGVISSSLSLKPVAQALEKIIDQKISFDSSIDESNAEADAKIIMMENTRFNPGEDENDPTYAQKLADLGELFVFDAFAVSHRASASTVGITKYIPAYAGLRVEKEVFELSKLLSEPEHPFLLIIGGAKIETKLPIINNMLNKADNIFVGGKLPHEILEKNLIFDDKVHIAAMNNTGLDISDTAIQTVLKYIDEAKLIVWNGPVGKFEDISAQDGTRAICKALLHSHANIVIGGGETIEAVTQFGSINKITFVSVGGGAMLEFLSGKKLPALEALET